MEIVFRTSNFDKKIKELCVNTINTLFEKIIGIIDELQYFVICDTKEDSFNNTINEFAHYLNTETNTVNNELFQDSAKALHGIKDDGDSCYAVVFKSGIILCLVADLFGNRSKATDDNDEDSMQWFGLSTVLHEVGHIKDYCALSKVDPFFASTKIKFDLSVPQEKREYLIRSCINLWSEYMADCYVFQSFDFLKDEMRENENQLINTITNLFGEDISSEDRVYWILYSYVRLLAQHGIEYCNTLLNDSRFVCYSGFLEAFGKEIISLHEIYPNWDINCSFDRISKLYSVLVAYEKSR